MSSEADFNERMMEVVRRKAMLMDGGKKYKKKKSVKFGKKKPSAAQLAARAKFAAMVRRKHKKGSGLSGGRKKKRKHSSKHGRGLSGGRKRRHHRRGRGMDETDEVMEGGRKHRSRSRSRSHSRHRGRGLSGGCEDMDGGRKRRHSRRGRGGMLESSELSHLLKEPTALYAKSVTDIDRLRSRNPFKSLDDTFVEALTTLQMEQDQEAQNLVRTMEQLQNNLDAKNTLSQREREKMADAFAQAKFSEGIAERTAQKELNKAYTRVEAARKAYGDIHNGPNPLARRYEQMTLGGVPVENLRRFKYDYEGPAIEGAPPLSLSQYARSQNLPASLRRLAEIYQGNR